MLLVSRGPCVALLLCVSLLGCARNPVSGRPEVVLVSRAQEVEIGRAEARKVEESMGLVDDPELQAWVGQLGARLAGRSPRQDVAYRFAVVDVAEPNAFALPGGHVYVSRGLLVLVNDTDELAAVLGHEIGHIAARHSVRRLTVAAPFALATGIPALLTGLVSPSLGETLAETGRTTGGLVLAPYGRGQERDADRIGMEIAAGAGYDPKALARFLATLEREEVAAGTARDRTSWLDSHPATPERRRDAERRAQKLSDAARPETPDGRSEVLARLDGLVVGPDPSGGLFVEGRFLHPGLDLWMRFPEGWETHNAREYVVALTSGGQVFVALHVAAQGDDPVAAARADGVSEEADLERLEIAGLPAARLSVEGPDQSLLVVWIARNGLVYRITGASPAGEFETWQPQFMAVAGSVRPLTPGDRQLLVAERLRIREAQAGETLAELVARSTSAWSPERAAIANGLEPEVRLEAGQRVKLAIPELWTGGRR